MSENDNTWLNRAFILAFFVLTFFCWCPLGYGAYGEVSRVLGIPSWAVVAFALSAVLFVLEWIYLFLTPMAMNDDDVRRVVSQLETLNTDSPDSAKEEA